MIRAGELHAGFRLASAGGELTLSRPDGSLASAFAPYPALLPGLSFGAVGDAGAGGALVYAYMAPSPGAANNAAADVGPVIAE